MVVDELERRHEELFNYLGQHTEQFHVKQDNIVTEITKDEVIREVNTIYWIYIKKRAGCSKNIKYKHRTHIQKWKREWTWEIRRIHRRSFWWPQKTHKRVACKRRHYWSWNNKDEGIPWIKSKTNMEMLLVLIKCLLIFYNIGGRRFYVQWPTPNNPIVTHIEVVVYKILNRIHQKLDRIIAYWIS